MAFMELVASTPWRRAPRTNAHYPRASVHWARNKSRPILEIEFVVLPRTVLSILWRASVSRLPDFVDVRLAPHEERVRRMLLADDAGRSNEYPVYAGLIFDAVTKRLWDNVMLPPVKMKVEKRWAYRMVFGGASWTVVVSGQGAVSFDQLTLQEDGHIQMTVCDWQRFAKLSGR